MRLSIDTLLLLARAGDREAETTAIWLSKNLDAEAYAFGDGVIGAGWPWLTEELWAMRAELLAQSEPKTLVYPFPLEDLIRQNTQQEPT